jgi:hypothetical protein
MELAVAIPMHMMAPVNAGTDSVVPVMNNIQMIPASAPGRAVMPTIGTIRIKGQLYRHRHKSLKRERLDLQAKPNGRKQKSGK